MQHDFYRPAGWHFLKGGLDANGKVVAWQQHFVSFGRDGKFAPSADLSADTYPARRIANLSYGASLLPLGVPTGPLRAPGDNALAFVFQSFIDELAHKAGKDPLQFQIDLLGKDELLPGRGLGFNTARARGVLEKVREVSGWGNRQLPERTGLGVAHYYSHLGYFAEVVEAAVAANGKIKINKVWAVGDIGSHVINPTAAFNMAQGAILDGFAEALQQKIRIEGGRVVEANFDTFPLLRMSQVAPIEVHFLTSDNSPTVSESPRCRRQFQRRSGCCAPVSFYFSSIRSLAFHGSARLANRAARSRSEHAGLDSGRRGPWCRAPARYRLFP